MFELNSDQMKLLIADLIIAQRVISIQLDQRNEIIKKLTEELANQTPAPTGQ